VTSAAIKNIEDRYNGRILSFCMHIFKNPTVYFLAVALSYLIHRFPPRFIKPSLLIMIFSD